MKKITFIILLVVSVAYTGCSDGGNVVTADTIVGTWNITDAGIDMKNMPEGMEAMLPMMEKAFLKSVYEYKSDGTYSMKTMMGNTTGKWTYDADNNTINHTKEGSDNTKIFQIKSGDESSMKVYEDKGEDGSITLILEKAETSETEDDGE